MSYKFICNYCGFKTVLEEDVPPNCAGNNKQFVPAHKEYQMRPYDREDKRKKKKHPIQPLEDDGNDVLRFKPNAIVQFLLDSGPFDLNDLAVKQFSREDREQFAQLIGYSLSGFKDLPYATKRVANKAQKSATYALRKMMNRYQEKK